MRIFNRAAAITNQIIRSAVEGLRTLTTTAPMPWAKALPVTLFRRKGQGKTLSIYERDHMAVVDEDDLANLLEDDRDIVVDALTNRKLQRFDKGYIKRRRIRKKQHQHRLFLLRKRLDMKALRRRKRLNKARRLSRWINRIRRRAIRDRMGRVEQFIATKARHSAFHEMQTRFNQMPEEQKKAILKKRRKEEEDTFYSAIFGKKITPAEPTVKKAAQLSRFAPQAPPQPHPAKQMLDTKFTAAKDGQSKHDPPGEDKPTVKSRFG